MTKDEFVDWLKFYLDKSSQDQIATIREKLSLVSDVDAKANYWSEQYPNKIVLNSPFVSTNTDNTINE